MNVTGVSPPVIASGSVTSPPASAVLTMTTNRYDARGRLAASTVWLTPQTGINPNNPPIATDPAQGAVLTTYT